MQIHSLTVVLTEKQKYSGYPGYYSTQCSAAQFSVSCHRIESQSNSIYTFQISDFCIRHVVKSNNTKYKSTDTRAPVPDLLSL